MRKVFLRDMSAYQFHSLQKFSDQIEHAVFSRRGGVSEGAYESLNVRFGIGDSHERVVENRRRVAGALGVGLECLVSADQTHSKNVVVVDEDFLAARRDGAGLDEVGDADAFVTNISGAALMVQVADCQGILMYEASSRVVAAVHAGWKGLKQDISGEVLRVMKRNFGVDVAMVRVGIAPSLGPCCAFFSNPEEELPVSFHPFIDTEKRVDLWGYSLKQLQGHGIQKGNIELARVCTQCHARPSTGSGSSSRDFYSFRGDHGITGRFGVAVALK